MSFFPTLATGALPRDCNSTLWFGPPSHSQLRQLSSVSSAITINQNIIKPSLVVRDLGVFFDAQRSMRQHVSRVSHTCFSHLHRIHSLCQLGSDVTATLVTALTLSRLDHCNAVLAGLPAMTLAPLQSQPCHSSFVGVALVADHRENTVCLCTNVRRTTSGLPACMLMPASDILSRSSLRSSITVTWSYQERVGRLVTGLSPLPHPVHGIGCCLNLSSSVRPHHSKITEEFSVSCCLY